MRKPLYGIHPVSPRQHLEAYSRTHEMMEKVCPESSWLDLLKYWEGYVTVILWISAGLFIFSLWARSYGETERG